MARCDRGGRPSRAVWTGGPQENIHRRSNRHSRVGDDEDPGVCGAPIEEGAQSGAGHCADLVPDDHTGNEFLSHPFRRPVHLANPA